MQSHSPYCGNLLRTALSPGSIKRSLMAAGDVPVGTVGPMATGNKPRMEAVVGDIVQEKVDVIVNAANEPFWEGEAWTAPFIGQRGPNFSSTAGHWAGARPGRSG